MNKNVSKIILREYKKKFYGLNTLEELKDAKKAFYAFFDEFGIYQPTVSKFIELKESEFKKDSLNRLIKPFEKTEPFKFNLKGLNEIEDKINKLDNPKLKFEFQGLFNLLSDECNLIYNPLNERKKIIKDLNKFKSLRFFKVSYLSRYDLKKEYKHLTYKNGSKIGHSQIYFIKNGLYVLKTLKKDDLNLKVFYIGNRYKTLLNTSKTHKKVLKEDKFNLSCVNAYKTLNKKDNMKYYSYCNSIGLDKKNRNLLRSIRKSKKISYESLIDSLESRKSEIMEDIKDCSNLEVLYYELELEDIEKKLQELKTFEEDNSMEDKTFLDDYF